MNYETLYLAGWGFQFWEFEPGIGYVLVLLGLIYRIRKRQRRSEPWEGMAVFHYLGGLVFLIFWVIILTSSIRWKFKVASAFRNHDYHIVEGTVESFHTMPKEGRGDEHFVVDSVYFSYSDYVHNGGFNQTRSHGGPIWGDGQWLKLSYLERGKENVIIKIESKK